VSLLMLLISGCGRAGSMADDVARIVQRTGASATRVQGYVDDLAPTFRQSSDDIAAILRRAAEAEATAAATTRIQRIRDSYGDDVVSLVCDVFADAILEPNLDTDKLQDLLVQNIAMSFVPDTWADFLGLAEDLASGDAAHPYWAKVTQFQLQNC